MTAGLLILTIFTVAFAMVAKRLSGTIVTAPMVFLALGVLLSTMGNLPSQEMEKALHLVAEIALVILLFLDAAQTDLGALRRRHVWPVRMLLVGLPLVLILGTLAAYPFLPGWPLAGVALVAALLAPTDAALGQAVVTNPVVPERVRPPAGHLNITSWHGRFTDDAVILWMVRTARAGYGVVRLAHCRTDKP